MREALLGGLAFGVAALVMSLMSALLWWDLAWIAVQFSTPTAFLIGAISGPRLAADARQSRNPKRGVVRGAIVTLVCYVLSAFVLAVWLHRGLGGLSEASLLFEVLGGVGGISFVFLCGAFCLPVALPSGMVAGWWFYSRQVDEV